jgi:transposase
MSDAASEIARLRAALAASEARVETAEARAETAESELAQVRAVVSTSEAMIRHLRLEIARLRREQYGHSSERRARLLDRMEVQLEELEAAVTEDEIVAKKATGTTPVAGFDRRRPARKPFPERLPRERVVIEAPSACSCCGSDRIVKMGEDSEPLCAIGSRTMASETLEVVSRQWKVVQTVREKFTCRHCEKISQSPFAIVLGPMAHDGSPFHATPRGWAGPNLLATILFGSEPLPAIGPRTMASGQHQPLNRQAERYAREGIDLSLSTRADQIGACAAALAPIHGLIRDHIFGAVRLQGDGKPSRRHAFETDGEHGAAAGEGRNEDGPALPQVRDDRPFSGGAPPAALFHFSRGREMVHPNRHLAGWQGILQAGACGGYTDLYRGDRDPGPVTSALCWSHARRKFFKLAAIKEKARERKPVHDISPSTGPLGPVAGAGGPLEAVSRIDAIFDVERDLNGLEPRRGSKRGSARCDLWSTTFTTGCLPSGTRCRSITPSPRRSPTWSRRTAGRPSPFRRLSRPHRGHGPRSPPTTAGSA